MPSPDPNASPTPAAPRHELRVLAGAQRGASLDLAAGRRWRIGGAWDCDVRLHGVAAAAEFELQADGVAWHALAEGLEVDGTPLPAGQSRRVPWLRPVVLDGTPLAVGPCGDAGWAALFDTTPKAAAAAPAAPPRPAASPRHPQRWGRWLVTGGAAVVAASLSMLALAVVITPAPPSLQQQAQRAEALLRSAGFTAVSVAAESGRVVVDGYFDTDAQRTRAEQLIASLGLQAQMRVWVNETVVRAVQDVYRVHGVQADVQAVGPGSLRVRTALADTSALPEVERSVRRDVQGLSRLDTANEPPPHRPSAVPALDDPGKRVAGIVAGAEPYVVTADGTRYFVGAMLPTGHRILAIAGTRVELEREGQLASLTF